jgi:metal-responsive CopG/Arc/MetJ family transcriptional regulator
MRTIIEIPDSIAVELDALAKRENLSRAAVIREAIRLYLESRVVEEGEEAFGIWGGRHEDGVAYQRGRRSEWGESG